MQYIKKGPPRIHFSGLIIENKQTNMNGVLPTYYKVTSGEWKLEMDSTELIGALEEMIYWVKEQNSNV